MSHVVASYVCRKNMFHPEQKTFVDSLYDYDYSGVNEEESSGEEAATVTETDHAKPVSHTAADQSKLVSYTDSISEQDIHVDINFNEPTDLVIYPTKINSGFFFTNKVLQGSEYGPVVIIQSLRVGNMPG